MKSTLKCVANTGQCQIKGDNFKEIFTGADDTTSYACQLLAFLGLPSALGYFELSVNSK